MDIAATHKESVFLLYGLDPPTLAFVCLVFALVGAIASWLPAGRAARVAPVIAMRSE